jgi:hypothetical protein
MKDRHKYVSFHFLSHSYTDDEKMNLTEEVSEENAFKNKEKSKEKEMLL